MRLDRRPRIRRRRGRPQVPPEDIPAFLQDAIHFLGGVFSQSQCWDVGKAHPLRNQVEMLGRKWNRYTIGLYQLDERILRSADIEAHIRDVDTNDIFWPGIEFHERPKPPSIAASDIQDLPAGEGIDDATQELPEHAQLLGPRVP